jgi:hypothetical protein
MGLSVSSAIWRQCSACAWYSGNLFNMELDATAIRPSQLQPVPATPRPNHGDFSTKPPDVQKSTRIRSPTMRRGGYYCANRSKVSPQIFDLRQHALHSIS